MLEDGLEQGFFGQESEQRGDARHRENRQERSDADGRKITQKARQLA